MHVQTNFQVQKIPSTHLTHSAHTLQAISQKAHAIDARIETLKVQSQKAQDALKNVPEDTVSRLDWLNAQLGI